MGVFNAKKGRKSTSGAKRTPRKSVTTGLAEHRSARRTKLQQSYQTRRDVAWEAIETLQFRLRKLRNREIEIREGNFIAAEEVSKELQNIKNMKLDLMKNLADSKENIRYYTSQLQYLSKMKR